MKPIMVLVLASSAWAATITSGTISTFSYAMSVTYQGIAYTYGSTPYTLLLLLQLSGPSVGTSVNFTPPNGPSLSNWSGVPFTATGTFAVMDGSTVILSDTLGGGGVASAFESIHLSGAEFGATYTFAPIADAPEPAAFALAASGLAAIGAARRRAS